jgi:RNA polymerase sigma-B factor
MAWVLSDREREVLRLRFEEDLTQSEIGRRVGLSQMHISRLLRQAVARLREVSEEPSSNPRRTGR